MVSACGSVVVESLQMLDGDECSFIKQVCFEMLLLMVVLCVCVCVCVCVWFE